MEKIKINNIEIDNLYFNEAVEKIVNLSIYGKKSLVFTPNLDHLAELSTNDIFLKAYKSSTLLIPDGMPLIWLSKIKGTPLKTRISGADIFKSILDRFKGFKKKFLIIGGSTKAESDFINKEISKIYPGINLLVIYPEFGFENNNEISKKIIEEVNSFLPEILFVCTGAPKSEIWLYENIQKLDFNVAVSVGAAPQFLTGIKRRAPYFVQKIGMEWLYRLICEPTRLFKRYIIKDLPFFIKIVLQIFSKE